jgi:hypothetical protein
MEQLLDRDIPLFMYGLAAQTTMREHWNPIVALPAHFQTRAT